MTTTLTEPVPFHPVEVDLLCALAEVGAPFPLAVPSTGTTNRDRTEVFRAARKQLAERGLADDGGPRGVAATFVRMLVSCAGTVDVIVADQGRNRGAVALLDGLRAMLVTQSPDDSEHVVWMSEVSTDDAVRELLARVPNVPAGNVPAFTMPYQPVQRVFDRLERRRRAAAEAGQEPDPMSDNDIDALLGESGVDDRMKSRLVSTMAQVTGSGQAGATCWQTVPGRWRRLPGEVHWVDTARGRFRLSRSADDEWASVNPLSRNDVRAELRALAAQVRGVE